MILIRADANEIIGTGHVMRCLSIANAFKRKGEDVVFVNADHKSDALIQNGGFPSICLNSNWTDMNGEIMKIKDLIKKSCPSILIVDSYYVTKEYFLSVSEILRTVYIDDINKEVVHVDTLINYNIFSSVFDYSVYEETDTKLLLGPKYAPLRTEFKDCKIHPIKKVSDVLISAGGSDPERITERIMNEICNAVNGVTFHFIVGALNPRLEEIKRISNEINNVILHINEQNMSHLMMKCDIAVSAAGTTLYELCACGIPTITYTLADNQLVAAKQFEKLEMMLNAGDCRGDKDFMHRLQLALNKLIDNTGQRKRLSCKMQKIVDGIGAERIVSALTD